MGVVRVEHVQRHFPGSKPADAVAAVGNCWTTRVWGSANAWSVVSTCSRRARPPPVHGLAAVVACESVASSSHAGRFERMTTVGMVLDEPMVVGSGSMTPLAERVH